MKITAEYFKKATGLDPERDDLERCNCNHVGQPGHSDCGWCLSHDKPVFMCEACMRRKANGS
jgi:hypothetical protein